MGKALTDEDVSKEREHDTAHGVLEAAQALVPELVANESQNDAGTECLWCGDGRPADTPYYDVDGRQCCEPCQAAANRHGAPFGTERTSRETNFTDTLALYERVDRDGVGEGIYLDMEDAWRETKPGEKVACAVYRISETGTLVRPGGPRTH